MLVEHIYIKNKSISIDDQSISFDQYGIYLLKGENGSGKTSLIKQLIFEKNTVAFHNTNQEKAYNKKREQLISYLPQDIVSYKCTVKDYLRKSRFDISDEKIHKCLVRLNADKIDLSTDFTVLSGGEKVKVALASLILKDTPYIFLDEPTNNLDNETVKDLTEFFNEYAKNHTIIIVSHDERLKLDEYQQVDICSNRIIQKRKTQGNNLNVRECGLINVNWFKVFSNVFSSKVRWLSIIVMLFVLLEAIFLNNINFQSQLSIGKDLEENIIAVYSVDQVYGELNQVYCEGKGLNLNENNYYTMVEYADIPTIVSQEGVDYIVMYDDEYFQKIYSLLYGNETMSEVAVIAPPEKIFDNFAELMGMMSTSDAENMILQGRYPKDGEGEVAISKQVLKKFFDYDDNMINEAIGKKIEIYKTTYTIVGIIESDVTFLSYDKNKNYGFYQYHPDTYQGFVDRQKKFRENQDWYLENEVDSIYIYTEKGAEEHILDWLMVNYPANNYNSQLYSRFWQKTYNKPIIFMTININLIVFAIISIFIFMINKGVLKLQLDKIKDYENYYIMNGKIRNLWLLSYIFEFIIVALIVSICNLLFSSLSYISSYILWLDALIMYLPIIIYSMYMNCRKIM